MKITPFKKYLFLSLVFALLNGVLLLVFFVPKLNHTDTAQYVSTIKHISGDSGSELFVHRLLKPLPILISSFLSPVLSPQNALVAQNFVFYLLAVWLVFLFIYHFYQNEKQAFYGTILYVGAFPMLAYGLASLTDMPGWFFYLFSILIALNFLKKPKLATAFLSGFVAGFGMLFKENVAAAPIFFAALVFIAAQLPFREKLKYILVFGAAFLIFPAINSIVIYNLYSFTYLDWYKMAWDHPTQSFYWVGPLRIIVEIGRVLSIAWIFVLGGIIKEAVVKNKERLKILLVLLFPSLSFFVWSFPHNRMMFIAAPLLVLLGSFGLLRNYKNPKINTFIEIALLLVYVSINYLILDFLLKYGESLQPYLIHA